MSIMLGQGLSGLTKELKSTMCRNRFLAPAAALNKELLLVVACESDTWHRRKRTTHGSKMIDQKKASIRQGISRPTS